MTSLARVHLVIQDDDGNVVDGASVEVRNEATLALAPVFSDRAGSSSLGNPFTAADGRDAGFYVAGGAYKIVATLGGFTRTIRYQAAGTLAEYDIDTFQGEINIANLGAIGDDSTNNTTVIQAAIDSAIAAKLPLRIPLGRFRYTAPLTINGPLIIRGDGAYYNWGSGISGVGINTPEGGPPVLLGSVLCPSSNGSNGINITGGALEVHLSDFGVDFQTHFGNTGHGIAYNDNTTDKQGLTGSVWSNLKVFGHNGNKYAFDWCNLIYCTFIHLQGFGGGLLHAQGKTTVWHYGNSVWVHPYGQVIHGGTAHGIYFESNTNTAINLCTLIRPQVIVTSEDAPANSPPSSAQKMFTMSSDVLHLSLVNPDFETTVGSGWDWFPHATNSVFGTGGFNSTFDINPTILGGTPARLAVLGGSLMKLQSGSSNNGSGTATITFETPFPNACIAVVLGSTGATINPIVNSFNTTGYSLTQAAAGTVYYLAYGY